MKSKILIVEDEIKYAYIIEKYFQAEDFEVKLAFDGMSGIEAFRSFAPDIVCLDVMLPKLDGLEVARRIREVSDVPIVIMSALSDDEDILKGYDINIDDYITKPFRNNILVAKIKAILSRRQELVNKAKSTVKADEALLLGDVKIVSNTMECFVKGELIRLTRTEFKLLEHLMKNAGKTCTRESLMLSFWEGKDIEPRIIDTYIKKLRKIILDGNLEIITVFGIGYRLEERNK